MRLKFNNDLTLPLIVFAFFFFLGNLDTLNSLMIVVGYFIFQTLGIAIGLHRCAGHGLATELKRTRLFFILGMLSHAGPLVGSAFDHTRHHKYADTEMDHDKFMKEGSRGNFIKMLGMKTCQKIFKRFNKFDVWLDKHFYAWALPIYFLMLIFIPEFFVGLFFATFIHNYIGGRVFHSRFGYRNFETKDKSKNSFLMFPFFLGENWHNNHHALEAHNYGVRWFEIDLVYYICLLFGLQNENS